MRRLAITCGDPAGVGPEIASHWAAENVELAATCAFIGPEDWCARLPGSPVPVGLETVMPGAPSNAAARVALAAMEEAAAGCIAGRYSAVVTGPVSKEWLARIGYPFPGQTEFFAARWGGEPTMGFVGERLKVVLATWHIPLMQVAAALTDQALTLAVQKSRRVLYLVRREIVGERPESVCLARRVNGVSPEICRCLERLPAARGG